MRGAGAGAAGLAARGACSAAGLGAVAVAGAGAGAAEITGDAGAGAGVTAVRVDGGSSSIVYSRTRRPLAQVNSRMTSTKGSCTTRSLDTRRYGRPSARLASVITVPGRTAP